jgi:hypothetical protein
MCLRAWNQVTTELCIWLGEMPVIYGAKITGKNYHVKRGSIGRRVVFLSRDISMRSFYCIKITGEVVQA